MKTMSYTHTPHNVLHSFPNGQLLVFLFMGFMGSLSAFMGFSVDSSSYHGELNELFHLILLSTSFRHDL